MRLVKGAYWDAEIKRGQERGLPGYPLYTRKPNTDVSYLACARYVFDQGKDVLYPQFATPQRAHGCGRGQHGEEGRVRVRIPAPARHG